MLNKLTSQENILYPTIQITSPLWIRSTSNINLPVLEETRPNDQLHESLSLNDMVTDRQH